jgi:hypothetical protein
MDSYAALGRAVRVADGYHAIGLEPPVAAEMVRRVRRYRPEESFTISLRVRWDERTEDCVVGEQL